MAVTSGIISSGGQEGMGRVGFSKIHEPVLKITYKERWVIR